MGDGPGRTSSWQALGEVPGMGLGDKISNAADEAKGKAKQAVGDAKDDEQLQAEGQRDEASGDLKQRGEHVKDAFKK